jgi:hypothetical protein
LPLSLKLIGLAGLLLFLGAFAASIARSLLPYHYFTTLGFPNLDNIYLSSVLLSRCR